MSNQALNRTSVVILTNKSGGDLTKGAVVITGTATAKAFTTTTTSGYKSSNIGVLLENIANNAAGMVALGQWVPKINLASSASLYDFIKCHTVAGQGTPHAAPSQAGDFAIALETGTSPSAFLFGIPYPASFDASALDITGTFALSGDISPSQITSNQNDYSPTGLSTATVLRLNSDASRNITGLAGGADGRIITIYNTGSTDIVLKNNDSNSSAANRFKLQADITLAGGDGCLLIYDSTSSFWRCIGKTPGGSGGSSGALVFLEAHTASNSATLDFTSFISPTYDDYVFEFIDIIPATDGAMLTWRAGTGGGPTYDSGSNYPYSSFWKRIGNTAAVATWGTTGSAVSLFNDSAGGGLSNVATPALSGKMSLFDPASASNLKLAEWEVVMNYYADDAYYIITGGGYYNSATAMTALRFLMSSGNITSGIIRVYGKTKS